MIEHMNRIRAALSAALSPAPAQTAATEAPSGQADPRAELNGLRHIAIPPARMPPAEGLCYVSDGQLAHIEDLDEEQRWHRETMEPLMLEWAERYLGLCELAGRLHAAMDYREEHWGVRQTARVRAGRKPSGAAFSLDRSMKLERTFSDRVAYDDLKMKRAHELMEQCVEDWEAGGRDEIRQIVALSFKKNAKGLYSRVEMTRLLKIKSEDKRWLEATKLIRDAETVDGVAAYLMLHIKDVHDKFHPLPLDIASVRPLLRAWQEAAP